MFARFENNIRHSSNEKRAGRYKDANLTKAIVDATGVRYDTDYRAVRSPTQHSGGKILLLSIVLKS